VRDLARQNERGSANLREVSKYGWVAAIRGISTIVATVVGAAVGAVLGAVASITVSLVWGRFTETGPEFRWDVLLLPAMLIVPVATVAVRSRLCASSGVGHVSTLAETERSQSRR